MNGPIRQSLEAIAPIDPADQVNRCGFHFWEIAAVDPEAVEMVLVGRFICAPSNRFETWADWSPETKRKGKADVFLLSACSGVGNESVQRSGSSAAN